MLDVNLKSPLKHGMFNSVYYLIIYAQMCINVVGVVVEKIENTQ